MGVDWCGIEQFAVLTSTANFGFWGSKFEAGIYTVTADDNK